jgi:hypothetical protein
MGLIFSNWVEADELLTRLEVDQDEMLVGDIYVQFSPPVPTRQESTVSASSKTNKVSA